MSENQIVEYDDDDAMEVEETTQPTSQVLSKSWAISSAHVPTYSGGYITHCHTKGLVIGDEEPKKFLVLPIDGDLALVDAQKGTKIRTIRQDDIQDDEDEGLDADAITAYALSSKDDIIITCSHNQLIRVYSLEQPDNIKTWGKSGHTMPVTRMKFHESNVFLATASVDGTVRIWDVRGGYVTHVFRPYQGIDSSGMRGVSSIQWKKSSDDRKELIIAIGREDGSISIHDLKDKADENLIVLRDHMGAITCMDWKDTDYFVSTGRDAVISLWQRIKSDDENNVNKKGKKSKSKKGRGEQYKRIHTKAIYEQVEGMIILPTKDLIVATAGTKGSVRLWCSKVSEGKGSKQFECIAEQSTSEAFGEIKGGYLDLQFNYLSDDKKLLDYGQLIVADAEYNLLFLSLSEENKLRSVRTIVGLNDEILDLKIVPNGIKEPTHAVVATNSSQVRLFELGTFSCNILDGHSATVLCVDVSPCGRYIVTSGKDKTIRVWLSTSCKCVAMGTGHTEAIGAIGFSRKVGRYDVTGKAAVNGGGSFAVSASKDRTLKRWNLPGSSVLNEATSDIDLKTFCSARAHEKDINILCVAPNDSLIATGSQDKTVKLWAANSLDLSATLKGHRRGVWDCQFSSYDKVIATSSGDQTVKLWSLSDYSCVRTFQGHAASVLRVRFLSGGLQLVSAGADGLLKLWTIRTTECEATIDAHEDKVWALDISVDGKKLVSGGADSKIVVWTDTTKQEEDLMRAVDEQNILLEQRLSNHVLHKEFEKALDLALDLERPRQILRVLNSIVEKDVQKDETGLMTLKRHVKTWSLEKVKKILTYCRDWNTRARNSHLAMLVVQAVVMSIPAQTLAKEEGIPQILAGITPYAERHFKRLDKMYTNAFLLDFTLTSMGSLDTEDNSQMDFQAWEKNSKHVLPPEKVDGRIQIGGSIILGGNKVSEASDEEEIVSIGDSESSSDDEAMEM
eukprot:CAMPEP_0194166932 /NCGR_PEP_ID=MMETSP0154-20130528/2403_1 /TAXON_ID=1049557 /ORGANISM="Thalassiothrix antarctica, Strain L6-D1" /LENGTH=960 /DNA_ID=CAMNT_0038877747 /DNA_START=19 /DNA_END=2901 /DNA_ORIENTATION=+